jgi:hypothetical protein
MFGKSFAHLKIQRILRRDILRKNKFRLKCEFSWRGDKTKNGRAHFPRHGPVDGL